MVGVDWAPLVTTALGAAIAFGGTAVAEGLRRRGDHGRDVLAVRRQAYLEFLLALGAGLQGLREVAATATTGEQRVDASDRALTDAGVYVARERFLMVASPAVVRAGEATFDGLIDVRDAVRAGARKSSPEFHVPYHPYSRAMWLLRGSIRADLGSARLSPGDAGRGDWDDRGSCAVCEARGQVPAAAG